MSAAKKVRRSGEEEQSSEEWPPEELPFNLEDDTGEAELMRPVCVPFIFRSSWNSQVLFKNVFFGFC